MVKVESTKRCVCFLIFCQFLMCRRAAAAARAMAALTSSSMSGVFPPIAAAMPLMPPMGTVPPIIPTKGKLSHQS